MDCIGACHKSNVLFDSVNFSMDPHPWVFLRNFILVVQYIGLIPRGMCFVQRKLRSDVGVDMRCGTLTFYMDRFKSVGYANLFLSSHDAH